MHLFANVTLKSPYIFQKQDVGLDAPARQQSRCSSTVQQIVMFGSNTGCSLALVQHIVHVTRSEGCIGQLHASLPAAKAKVGPKLGGICNAAQQQVLLAGYCTAPLYATQHGR